ncbi:MAG: hypothetical protein OXF79_06075 [Chloroflexi bacterium]|nr:hypothetical protein [Chloroflexota bacterium]
MTTTVTGNSKSAGPEYRFSLERLEELNRSPIPLLLARLSTACPSFGKMTAEIADASDLVKEIRTHCAGDTEFIQSSMPLQEIVFRTLLLQGGEPMRLSELHAELTEKWSSPIRPITLSVGGLARVLDNDVFYGFAAIPVEEPEPEETPDGIRMLAASRDDEVEQLSRILEVLAADDDEDEDLFGEDDLDDEDDDVFEDDEDQEPD